jgi:5-formyltetrahydrofolate cyclo-ligase
VLNRGSAHTAPTYASRDQGSLVPTALAGRHFNFAAGAMTEISDIKAEARRAAAKVRNAAHTLLKDDAPLLLASHDFPVLPTETRKVVSAFFPYKSEIDTRLLLGKLAGEGWTTCLPIVIALREPLVFRRWMPGEPTIPGVWDIPRPTCDAPIVEPDVLLVPLMAFDRKGYRLGYGGGFYDQTLELLRAKKSIVAIGVSYAAQEVDSVVHDGHDQLLDFVMTEKGVFACG